MRFYGVLVFFLLFLVEKFPLAHADTTFAIIVGVNRSHDPSIEHLNYADDDAILFHHLFSKRGSSTLLVSADENTQRLYPDLVATPPTRQALLAAIDRTLAQIDTLSHNGTVSNFYFIYSGHGDVQNNEGFLVLHDGKFTSTDLITSILNRSKAAKNHIIVDACKSYYLVNEKRAQGIRRPIEHPFHRSRNVMQRFPNTGVILSTSSDANSHEWGELQAGIFSHEVRSGLIGAADVNRDRKISYEELWAFTYVANMQVANERFRPTIFMHPPHADPKSTLFDLHGSLAEWKPISPPKPGRYFLETQSGVRLADLNFDESALITLYVPKAALYLHDVYRRSEYVIDPKTTTPQLIERQPAYAQKGAEHDAFKQLFQTPFSVYAFESAARRWRNSFAENETLAEPFATLRESASSWNHAIHLSYQISNGFLQSSTVIHGVGLGYLVRFRRFQWGAELNFGASAYQRRDGISVDVNTVGGTVIVDYLPFHWRVRPTLGLESGIRWGWQRGTLTDGFTLNIIHPLFHYRGRIGVAFPITTRWNLCVLGTIGQTLFKNPSSITAALQVGGHIAVELEL